MIIYVIIDLIGGAITSLTAVQNGLTTVRINWTAPPGPPAGGYQITVAEASINVTGRSGSPYTFTASELGVYTVQVLYTSQHFPNEQAMPVMVTVKGEGDSVIHNNNVWPFMHIGIGAAIVTTSSQTATSVTISWSPQPAQFRLPVVEYTVSLTLVTGSGQAFCTQVMDSRPAVTTTDTSIAFTGLEEFSTYTVTVITTFNVFGSNMDVASDMMFTTLSTGM